MSPVPEDCFSLTYAEATAKLRRTAAAGGIAVESCLNPAAQGPNGEALETLVAEIGPANAPNLVILNSGTHGTEGLVGAGVISALLQAPDELLAQAPDTRFVMIHIINPYGCAWSRYVNEDNVDLMKNFVYGERATAPDRLFVEFDDVIDLEHVLDPGAAASAMARRKAFVDKYGFERLMACLKKGQSDRPRSICFNGRGAAWSTRTLNRIVGERARDARQVLFIDLHSGVGGYGEAYVIAAGDAASAERVRSWFGERAHGFDIAADAEFYTPQAAMAPHATFTAATVEAGTVTFDDGFRELMWLEMHHHMFGDPLSPAAREVSRRFRAYYYPEDAQWRALWLANIRATLSQFLSGFNSFAAAERAA